MRTLTWRDHTGDPAYVPGQHLSALTRRGVWFVSEDRDGDFLVSFSPFENMTQPMQGNRYRGLAPNVTAAKRLAQEIHEEQTSE